MDVPVATKSKITILSNKVTVQVTRSLTFMSFERTPLIEYPL